MDRENHLKSKQIKKIVKINMIRPPHVNKKAIGEKTNFCSNTIFSIYFKFSETIHAAKPLAFSLHFLFQSDQNHHPNTIQIL